MTVFDRYEPSLQTVEKNLYEFLKSGDRYINGSLDYLQLMRGKMLRPLLQFVGAEIAETQPSVELATALEMLHVGTLLHDDVIDESKFRRGMESIQSKYSKEYAIYMGDYLFSSIFVYLSSMQFTDQELVIIAKVMQKICLGEMKQYHNRHNIDLSLREYMRIITGKTAMLFALSLSSAAREKNLKRLLFKIGYHIGMAFQIQDDLLDFEGDEGLVGKELQKDISVGNYNLPIVLALCYDKTTVQGILDGEGALTQDLRDLVVTSGALEESKHILSLYFTKIMKEVALLPDNQGKSDLTELIHFLVKRNF